MRRSSIELERRQLSRKLGSLKKALYGSEPTQGWIRAIREVLGMSARQLGQRIGLKQTHITRIEQGEVRGTTTLNTLKKVANSLGCDLVYAFVPRESLEGFLEDQAKKVATGIVRRTAHSMDLEEQKTSENHRKELIDKVRNQLIKELPRTLWDHR